MGKRKIHKGSLVDICLSCYYGDHEIYPGNYQSYDGKKRIIWTQAGDDCEGNNNSNPAADVEITEKKD